MTRVTRTSVPLAAIGQSVHVRYAIASVDIYTRVCSVQLLGFEDGFINLESESEEY